jgi:predicted flap endonuclease-1-like 5' DNA nuclease
MGYLVAKMVVLLVLAAACGFWLAYAWLRLRYRDVTEEHTRLLDASAEGKTATAEGIKRIEERLRAVDDAVQALGLDDFQAGLRGWLGERVSALERTVASRLPQPVDLEPVSERLEALEGTVARIGVPDLDPIEARLAVLAAIADRLSSLERQVGSLTPRPPDFGPVNQRIEALAAAVGDRIISLEHQVGLMVPAPADLTPVTARIEALAAAVGDRLASLEHRIGHLAPAAPDLGPVTSRLETLERAIARIQIPDVGPIEAHLGMLAGIGERLSRLEQAMGSLAPAPADLEPVNRRIEALAAAMGDRLSSLERLLVSLEPRPLDLEPVLQRLQGVERAVTSLPAPDLRPLEARLAIFAAVGERLEALEQRVASLGSVSPAGDVGPAQDRIYGLERQLEEVRSLVERVAARPAPGSVLAGSRNLLRRPVYGPPDDLKRIRGIGEALERLLHRLGVYYFWQVAEWDRNDVRFVDAHLEIFRGRIERDQWVEQARALTGEPGAASRPESLDSAPDPAEP